MLCSNAIVESAQDMIVYDMVPETVRTIPALRKRSEITRRGLMRRYTAIVRNRPNCEAGVLGVVTGALAARLPLPVCVRWDSCQPIIIIIIIIIIIDNNSNATIIPTEHRHTMTITVFNSLALRLMVGDALLQQLRRIAQIDQRTVDTQGRPTSTERECTVRKERGIWLNEYDAHYM
jgi:hypothetical protein